MKCQNREDEPTAPTYDLYQQGTIFGDRVWHEQGFNSVASNAGMTKSRIVAVVVRS